MNADKKEMSLMRTQSYQYKNLSKGDSVSRREKRRETGVKLRKQKTEEELFKRRLICTNHDIEIESPPIMSHNKILTRLLNELIPNSPKELEILKQICATLTDRSNPHLNNEILRKIVKQCVRILTTPNSDTLQCEACMVLANIASGDSAKVLIEGGALQVLLLLVNSPVAEVGHQAIWALANVAADSRAMVDKLVDEGIVFAVIKTEPGTMTETHLATLVWLCSSLVRTCVSYKEIGKISLLIPFLVNHMSNSYKDTALEASKAVSVLSYDQNEGIDAILRANVVEKIIETFQNLDNVDSDVLYYIVRTVLGICSGTDKQTEAITQPEILQQLCLLISHGKVGIVQKSLCCLGNIATGNLTHIDYILDHAIPLLVWSDILGSGNCETQKEAVHLINNVFRDASIEQVFMLIAQFRTLGPFLNLLKSPDANLVSLVLTGFSYLCKKMEEYNVLSCIREYVDLSSLIEKLEDLQNHKNRDIGIIAMAIAITYFSAD